jgi:hypothetical protein
VLTVTMTQEGHKDARNAPRRSALVSAVYSGTISRSTRCRIVSGTSVAAVAASPRGFTPSDMATICLARWPACGGLSHPSVLSSWGDRTSPSSSAQQLLTSQRSSRGRTPDGARKDGQR